MNDSMKVIQLSVQNENELLRAQLDVLQQRDKQQRAEYHALKDESEYRLREMELKLQDQRVLDSRKLGAEADLAKAELMQAQTYNERLKTTLDHATAEDAQRISRLVALDATLTDAARNIGKVTDQIAALQRQILPTFRMDTPVELPDEPSIPPGISDEYGIYAGSAKLEKQVVMLKMIFDAKLETLGLIRSKLNDENLVLRSELERANARVTFDSSLPSQLDMQVQAERDKARLELEQTKAHYEAELKRIKTWVADFQAAAQSTNERATQAQEQYTQLQNAYRELEEENRRVAKSLSTDQDARVQLAADLASERKETASLRQQLDQLKMAQKFLASGTKKIPDAKMDLMKTINSLMEEVKRLKDENAQMDLELHQAKREKISSRVASQLTNAEVEMAAHEQVTDSELTAKILRRNLESITAQSASNNKLTSIPLP